MTYYKAIQADDGGTAPEIGWLEVPGFSVRRIVRQVYEPESHRVIGWSALEEGAPTWNARSYPDAVFTPARTTSPPAPPVSTEPIECCASGRCEVCAPGAGWSA